MKSEAMTIADWIASPQCGLLGDERIQRAAKLLRDLEAALRPFAALGGPNDGICTAFHDLPADAVVYENSGAAITAGDVRLARSFVSFRSRISPERQPKE